MGKMLNVKEWPSHLSIAKIDMETAAFWVQVHSLPLNYMSPTNVRVIGSQLGSIVAWEDSMYKGIMVRSFLRIRVLISLKRLLKLGFWLSKPNAKRLWVRFRYERLQHFCFGCGLLGHEQKECMNPRIWGAKTPEFKRYNSKLEVAPARALDALISELHHFAQPFNETISFASARNCNSILDEGTIQEVSVQLQKS